MKQSLNYNEIYNDITIYNIEEVMAQKLKKGQDITEIKNAAKFFHKNGKMNLDTFNWYVNTDIKILKECYL